MAARSESLEADAADSARGDSTRAGSGVETAAGEAGSELATTFDFTVRGRRVRREVFLAAPVSESEPVAELLLSFFGGISIF